MNELSATKMAIIDAAENLWAEHGIEGASLRQIGAAAGCGNASAVQYHFHNKQGLITALYRARLEVLEAERKAMLAPLLPAPTPPTVAQLAGALFRPVANLRNREGKRVFAAFQLNVARHNQLTLRYELSVEAPVTEALTSMLQEAISHLKPEQLIRRIAWASAMFWFGLVSIDQRMWSDQRTGGDEEALVEELLHLITQALAAPA